MSWTTSDIPDQTGRVAVVTGGNGGLGLATVTALAGAGAHVVMAARDQDKAASAVDHVRSHHPGASLEVVELDLGSLASVAAAASTIVDAHDRLDVLVNNAGVMAMPERTTEDGFEMQFGVDHLGHWAFTAHLLPLVVTTPGARVVTVSSTARFQGSPVDPEDPFMRGDYDAWRMYGQAKLANHHFAIGLQRALEQHGVDARSYTAHPGLTNSDLQSRTVREGGGGGLGSFFERLTARVGMSTDDGARSQLRAATDPDADPHLVWGPLFGASGPPVGKPMLRHVTEAQVATLWEVSQRETGVALDVAGAAA